MRRRSPILILSSVCGLLFATTGLPARGQSFDPQNDYSYDLSSTNAEVVEVDLESEGFLWPQLESGGDTAFLEIVLEETEGEAPRLAARSEDVEVYQIFEEHARGRRFLDVSLLLKETSANTPVVLTGDGVSWQKGGAQLFVYSNPVIERSRVLVLAPHPDDAEIAAFGIYRDCDADVITVTSGDAGGENFRELFPEPGSHYRIKGWVRTLDSITVPYLGGVVPGRARNLGYYDAMLKPMQAEPETAMKPLMAELDDPGYYRSLNIDPDLRDRPFPGTWEGLVDDLVWELDRVQPSVVFAAHPMLDSHADHQFATIALIDALERWEGDCELYLYTNHAIQNEAFPLGDRNAMTGLPPWSGGDLFFDRIYSHPLSEEEQKLKLIALEAMHDLRAFDLRDGSVPYFDYGSAEGLNPYDYYRRGPRPNELFFVVSRDDAIRLRNAFLESN